MSRTQTAVLAVLIPLVLVGAFFGGRALRSDDDTAGIEITSADDDTTFEYDYYIPEGTAARIDAGELIEIVPQALEVEVGESIRIVNDDVEDHLVGLFFVAAGETMTQTFTREGVLEGQCSVHPSGSFTLTVTA